jgi:hypothetical protein
MAHPLTLGLGAQGEAAVVAQRVERVVDQVRPHLVELRARGLDARQRGVEVADDLDPAVAQLVGEHGERALEALVDVDALARPLVEVGVVAHGADEVGDARRRLLELGQHDAGAGGGGDEAQAGAEVAVADGRRDAVDPLGGEPRLGESGRDPVGVRDAAILERLHERLLAVALGERVEPLAR